MYANVPITPGTGEEIATDEINGAKFQRVKVTFGPEGDATDASPANPLPVTSPSDFPDAASLAKLEAVRALLAAGIPVSGTFWQSIQPVSVDELPLPNGASTEATLAQAVSALAALLAELQAKTEPGDTQAVAPVDTSLVERLALKALAKLTYTLNGLRVDASGATITANIASNQTLATVSLVNGLGYNAANGQAIQQSVAAYQLGFRRNLIVS